MGGNRLARPHGTHLRNRRIAHSKYKIHRRRAGSREFIPAFAPKSLGGQACRSQLFQCMRMHAPLWVATRTVRTKIPSAPVIQNGFGQDGTRGISRAQEQNVKRLGHGRTQSQQGRSTQPGGQSHGACTGLLARTKALMNLSLTSGATFSASNPAASRNVRASST